MSTLKPPCSSSALVTGAMLVSTGNVVDCISTTGEPSYPASFRRALDFSKSGLTSRSPLISKPLGVPHTKAAVQTL
jgi:hypothetical protein